MRACACGLRSVWPQSIPGAIRSLAYANSPFTFGGASSRGTSSPTLPDLQRARCGLRHCAARPAAPRRRSSRSRCSGRGCPRAPRGSRRRSGSGSARSRSAVATTRPGVQKPHCTAPASTNASCTRCSSSPSASPSTVVDLVAVGLRREHEARADERAVEQHRARAALALLARVLRAREAELLAQREEQRLALPAVGLVLVAVDAQRDPHASTRFERALGQHAQRVAPVAARAAHVVDRRRRRGDALGERVAPRRAARSRAPAAATPSRTTRAARRRRETASETTAITIAFRGPTFMNVCGARRRRAARRR